jgi:hypothetical protein
MYTLNLLPMPSSLVHLWKHSLTISEKTLCGTKRLNSGRLQGKRPALYYVPLQFSQKSSLPANCEPQPLNPCHDSLL